MYTEDIYTAAAAICGEESEFLRLLCTAAEEELTYRLKSDISPGDIEEIFIAAASLLAVSMFKGTSSGADGIKSFPQGRCLSHTLAARVQTAPAAASERRRSC